MKDKTEFMTTIYVDSKEEYCEEAPAVVYVSYSEEVSLRAAMQSFKEKGLKAKSILRIETVQIPQRYTASEMA